MNKFDGKKQGSASHTNGDNDLVTCPVCGRRTRNPKHPLCFTCNKDFNAMQSDLLKRAMAGEDVKVPDRLEYALEKGKETLAKKKAEAETAKTDADDLLQPLWKKAHDDVTTLLQKKQLRNVDREVYNEQVRLRMDVLLNDQGAKEKAEALKKRAYGLRKTVESLEGFIREAQIELKARKAAAQNGGDSTPLVDEGPQESKGSGKQAQG